MQRTRRYVWAASGAVLLAVLLSSYAIQRTNRIDSAVGSGRPPGETQSRGTNDEGTRVSNLTNATEAENSARLLAEQRARSGRGAGTTTTVVSMGDEPDPMDRLVAERAR